MQSEKLLLRLSQKGLKHRNKKRLSLWQNFVKVHQQYIALPDATKLPDMKRKKSSFADQYKLANQQTSSVTREFWKTIS